jgi:hypothetical protein
MYQTLKIDDFLFTTLKSEIVNLQSKIAYLLTLIIKMEKINYQKLLLMRQIVRQLGLLPIEIVSLPYNLQ